VLVLVFLVWLAVELELDFILGALAAGLIVGLVARGETGTVVRDRTSLLPPAVALAIRGVRAHRLRQADCLTSARDPPARDRAERACRAR
jgi:hypothetical protein